MAKKEKGPRMLLCIETGVHFPYRGVGRPPKFCPAEQKRRQAEQRKTARKNAKLKKAA